MLSEMDKKVKYRSIPKEESGQNAIKGTDVFEITDFTTASDWERMIVRLEDVIHEWKLPAHQPETKFIKHSFSNLHWQETWTEIADVPDFEFKIKRVRLVGKEHANHVHLPAPVTVAETRRPALLRTSFSVEEFPAVFEQMLSMENDFPLADDIPPLARWFGLGEFVVLCPSSFNTVDETVSEDRLKLLHSCISMAACNTQCPIPMLVQFDEPGRHMYVGVSECSGFRTCYQVIDLERIPDHWQTLSGLVDMFKAKIGNENSHELIKTSVQLTFKLRPDTAATEEDEKEWQLGQLPFGSRDGDNFLINLHATWPNANADALEDTLLRSDLDPLQAPKWSTQLVFNDKALQRLAEAVRKFAQQTYRQETVKSMLDYLDPVSSELEDPTASEALRRLTGDVPDKSRLSRALYSRLPKYHLDVPIPPDQLNPILAYLFPDSDLAKQIDKSFHAPREPQGMSSMKAAPCDSLATRLALAVWFVFEKQGGLLGVAYLWQEVQLELRYRWENGFLLPGVQSGPPNHATCLLHQKLQMLNCCIEKRTASSNNTLSGGGKPASMHSLISLDGAKDEELMTEDEDDEFYDCYDEMPATEQTNKMKAEGRLEAHTGLKLIGDGMTPLYIPVTQEVAPMTEDVLAAHMERLVAEQEAGTTTLQPEDVALRSDMAAFKAANPQCSFADFVRWHSPRDWLEQEGHLSERMSQPESAWLQAWNSTEARSVKRQKRLFDERIEAEKVLNFFNSSLGDVFRHLLPLFLKAALVRLLDEMVKCPVEPPSDKDQLIKAAARLLSANVFDWIEFERLARKMASNEQTIWVAGQLERMCERGQHLAEQETLRVFLRKLVECRQVVSITGGARSPLGQQLTCVLVTGSGADKAQWPASSVKQMILRSVAPRPYPFNRPALHRLYACFKADTVRIATALSDDCLYG